MSRASSALLETLENLIPAPVPPLKPNISALGEMPPDHSIETRSDPYLMGNIIIVRSMYWKRFHFCTIECGSVCKLTWRVRCGISRSDIEEIALKVGGHIPGVTAEIGRRRGPTIVRSSEEEVTREFTRAAPNSAGVTHARWQLVERYTFTWLDKRWFRDPEIRCEFIEGNVEAFAESHLFYLRPDCCSDSCKNIVEKLQEGHQPFIIQGDGSGTVALGKPRQDGSIALDGFASSYNVGDRVSGHDIVRYLHSRGCNDTRWPGRPAYLLPYQGSIASFIRSVSGASANTREKMEDLKRFGIGLAIGVMFGHVLASGCNHEDTCHLKGLIRFIDAMEVEDDRRFGT